MATPEEMAASQIRNLKEKTGKTLEQWLEVARTSGQEKHGMIVKFLKDEHGLTHGYANLVAQAARGGLDSTDEGALVDAQYAGPKAGLRPLYEALVAVATKLGKDVVVSPKKTYVSLRRKKQFAFLKAATKSRIDVGLNLKGEPLSARLQDSGSLGAMVSHRVEVTDKKEVDAELKGWLKQAYDRAG